MSNDFIGYCFGCRRDDVPLGDSGRMALHSCQGVICRYDRGPEGGDLYRRKLSLMARWVSQNLGWVFFEEQGRGAFLLEALSRLDALFALTVDEAFLAVETYNRLRIDEVEALDAAAGIVVTRAQRDLDSMCMLVRSLRLSLDEITDAVRADTPERRKKLDDILALGGHRAVTVNEAAVVKQFQGAVSTGMPTEFRNIELRNTARKALLDAERADLETSALYAATLDIEKLISLVRLQSTVVQQWQQNAAEVRQALGDTQRDPYTAANPVPLVIGAYLEDERGLRLRVVQPPKWYQLGRWVDWYFNTHWTQMRGSQGCIRFRVRNDGK